jgi:hypothetical protein
VVGKQAAKNAVNAVLRRTVGCELRRSFGRQSYRIPPLQGDRLLVEPVFIFSAARSGSTLLRVILGGNSRLYAPPEVHLVHLGVRAETQWMQASMTELRLTTEDLEQMLWDRVLAGALARSGKPTIVVKTPSNVLMWRRIADCWPDARFIFLLRHPAAAVASLHASWDPDWHPGTSGTLGEAVKSGLRYMTKVEEARRALAGITVRYEDLTANPEAVIRRVSDFLTVPFEPAMLTYGRRARDRFAPGLGDASDKIRSGRIQAPAALPCASNIPEALKNICATWGYFGDPHTSQPGRADAQADLAQ